MKNILNGLNRNALSTDIGKKTYHVANNIFFMGDSHNEVTHNNVRQHIENLPTNLLMIVKNSLIEALSSIKENWQIYGVLLTRNGIEDEVHPFIAKTKDCVLQDIPGIYEALLDDQSKRLTGMKIKDALKAGKIHAYGYMFFPMGAYDLETSEELLLEGFESGNFRYHDKLHPKHKKTYTESMLISSIFKNEFSELEHNPDWRGLVQPFK